MTFIDKDYQLKDAVAMVLGHILFEVSRLESNINFRLQGAPGGLVPTLLAGKLEALCKGAERCFPAGSETRTSFDAWIGAMESFRKSRNKLVHGRWAFHNGLAINVLDDIEDRFDLESLRATLEAIRKLSKQFDEWACEWPY